MMRLLFGVVLALLVVSPTLAAVVLAALAYLAAQPAVLAFAVGVWAWPRITRRIKGWSW